MKFIEKIRYALSDLKTRLGWSFGTAAVVSCSVTAFLLIAFAVQQHLAEQTRDLEKSMPRRITVECSTVAQTELTFDAVRLDELRSLDGIELCEPLIDLGLRIDVQGGKGDFVVGESVFPNDPICSANRLEWGRSVASPEAHEVVLSAAFLRKLGGSLGPGGPTPTSLWIDVARTRDGQEETKGLTVEIVGVLRHSDANRVYLPYQTLFELDAWCAGRWSAFGELADGARLLTFDYATAYVSAERKHLLDQDIAHLGIAIEETGSVNTLHGPVPAWIRMGSRGGDGPRSSGDEYGSFVHIAQVNGEAVKIVALHDDDPRLSAIAPEFRPAFGEVLSLGRQYPSGVVTIGGWPLNVLGRLAGLPSLGGELLAHPQTLARLAFDPLQSKSAEDWIFVEADNARVAEEVERLHRATMRPTDPFAWSVLIADGEPNLSAAESQRAYEQLRQDVAPSGSGMEAALIHGYAFSFEGSDGRSRSATVQFVPEEFSAKLLGRTLFPSDRVPVIYAYGPERGLPRLKAYNDRPVTFVGEIDASLSAFWLPVSELGRLRKKPPVIGIAVWSEVPSAAWRAPDVARRAAAFGLPLRQLAEARPSRFRGMIRDRGEVRGTLPVADGLAAASRVGVRATLTIGSLKTVTLCVWDGSRGDAALPSARVSERSFKARSAVLSSAIGVEHSVELSPSPDVMDGVVEVGWQMFCQLTWDASDSPNLLSAARRVDVRVDDLALWNSVLARASETGRSPQPLSEIVPRELIRFRVQDPSAPAGSLDENLVRLVRSARASIQRVVPHDARTARVMGRNVEFTATSPHDPARFSSDLLAGTWIGTAETVVLSRALADRLFPGASPDECIDRTLRAWFASEAGRADGELPVELRIVGVTAHERSFAAADQFTALRRWDAGELIFDPGTEQLLEPVAAREASGALRAVANVTSVDAIGPVVSVLEGQGYIVRHRLEEIEAVRRIAHRAWLFAKLLIGCLVGAGLLLSWSITSHHVHARRREIGILCALGLPRHTVLEIQVLQGALLGCVAFATSILLAIPGSIPVQAALPNPNGSRIWSPEYWGLFLAALAISVACPIVGAFLGAWSFTRQPVLRSLRGED